MKNRILCLSFVFGTWNFGFGILVLGILLLEGSIEKNNIYDNGRLPEGSRKRKSSNDDEPCPFAQLSKPTTIFCTE
jgi:hypothetical protein